MEKRMIGPKRKRKKRSNPKKVTFLAGDACRYEVVRKCAREKVNWKLVPQSMRHIANVLWIDTSNIGDFFRGMKPWQSINHFPGMINIAQKSRLVCNLDVMRRRFPKEYSFYPKTYILPLEAQSLHKDYFSNANGLSSTYFILKPSGGCQGRGIYITRSWENIEKTINYVAQKYIRKPLLIDKKKFDLRLYVLVTSCKPLRMFLYRDGLVRLCTEDYVAPNAQNTKDMCMHLTNYSINKVSEKFEFCDEDKDDEVGCKGSKRSLKWFMKWLKEERGEEMVAILWSKIGEICTKTVLSILPTLIRDYNTTFRFRNKYDLRNDGKINGDHHLSSDKCSKKSYNKDEYEVESEGIDRKVEERAEVKLSGHSDDGSSSESSSLDEIDCTLDCRDYIEQNLDDIEQTKDNDENEMFERRSRCFQILGFDILIDDNLKPYLIEVNHLPSFGTDHEIDKKVKSKLVQQTLSIVKSKANDKELYEEMKKKDSERRIFRKKLQSIENCEKIQSNFRSYRPTGKNNDNKEEEQVMKALGQRQVYKFGHENGSITKMRDEIQKLYEKFAPLKAGKVPNLLRKYRGYESWLLVQVKKKYGVDDKEKSSIADTTASFKSQMEPIKRLNEYTSNPSTSSNDSSIDPITEEESKLLSDFDRIYPQPLQTSSNVTKVPNYKDMEEYIFDQDFRQQMRMLCPLRQARTLDPIHFKTIHEIKDKEEIASSYKVWSSECWKEPTLSEKRNPDAHASKAVDFPMPSQKQIEAAERLSLGIAVKNDKLTSYANCEEILDAAYPSCYVDPCWQLNCQLSLPSAKDIVKSLSDQGCQTNQQLHPVFRRKGFQAEAVKPVNFKFFECSVEK